MTFGQKTPTPTGLCQLLVHRKCHFFIFDCFFFSHTFFVYQLWILKQPIFFFPMAKTNSLTQKAQRNNIMSMRPNEQNKQHDYGAWHEKCFAVMSDCIAHMFRKSTKLHKISCSQSIAAWCEQTIFAC